jgi:TatD DNase family protein
LAVVIHCRMAEADVLRTLRVDFDAHGSVKGVMHSFTGDAATAEACLAMGLHISFAGMVTYKNAQNLRDVAKSIPLERLLIETDSPYLAPVPLRGKRNEPANVVHTAACLATVKEVASEVIAEWTTRNARTLFGIA